MSVDFFDSNIFIYLFDPTDERKRSIAHRLIDSAIETDRGCISFQVVQEALRVVAGKIPKPLTADDAQAFLKHSLQPLWRVMPSAELLTAPHRTAQSASPCHSGPGRIQTHSPQRRGELRVAQSEYR